MSAVVVLLASPLLGPAVWSPVAEELLRRGWTVVGPPAPPVAPRSPEDVLDAVLAALPSDRDLILVPHSNAGLYVPALTQRRRVAGFVFVDAGLPAATGPVALAPPAFLDFLTTKADADGLLPLWTHWWDEDVSSLFPDAPTKARVEAEQSRLPLSYFRGSVPVPPGWDDRPGAYLAFGDTYADERADAVARGWPVTTLAGEHLHQLIDPAGVTAALLALFAELGLSQR
jgi:hypothetical protein